MSAIRLARGYTKRDKIIKFEGCYHGHADHLLVKSGSGLATMGIASSAGVPASFAKDTIVLPLADKYAVVEAFKQHKDKIACIIIEPVPANNGLLIQDKDYLKFLRDITQKNGALLIFDEVISGFRISFTGAAGYYNIQPDLITYGKIIGGGMPVGCYGGDEEIMNMISPVGEVYQAGTLSGNPVAMAAGVAQLSACLQEGFYQQLYDKTNDFIRALANDIEGKYPVGVVNLGSIFWIYFMKSKQLKRADQIDPEGMKHFSKFHHEMLLRGFYFGPSGYEVSFVSAAHSKEDLVEARVAICESLDVIFRQ